MLFEIEKRFFKHQSQWSNGSRAHNQKHVNFLNIYIQLTNNIQDIKHTQENHEITVQMYVVK